MSASACATKKKDKDDIHVILVRIDQYTFIQSPAHIDYKFIYSVYDSIDILHEQTRFHTALASIPGTTPTQIQSGSIHAPPKINDIIRKRTAIAGTDKYRDIPLVNIKCPMEKYKYIIENSIKLFISDDKEIRKVGEYDGRDRDINNPKEISISPELGQPVQKYGEFIHLEYAYNTKCDIIHEARFVDVYASCDHQPNLLINYKKLRWVLCNRLGIIEHDSDKNDIFYDHDNKKIKNTYTTFMQFLEQVYTRKSKYVDNCIVTPLYPTYNNRSYRLTNIFVPAIAFRDMMLSNCDMPIHEFIQQPLLIMTRLWQATLKRAEQNETPSPFAMMRKYDPKRQVHL